LLSPLHSPLAGGLPVFRPPYGALRPGQAWQLARAGRRVALWSRDSRDYREATAESIARVGESLRARDILLLHDRVPAAAGGLAVIECSIILYCPYVGIMLFLAMLYLRPESYFPPITKLHLPLLLSCFTLFAWLVQVLLKRETCRWRTELAWMAAFAAG